MNERAQLALDAAQLSPGSTIRMVCPFCGGGSTKEASLALTHAQNGSLLFYCHRSRCNAKGMLGGGPYVGRSDGHEPRASPEWDITGNSESFPVWVRERCVEEWTVDPQENHGWLWDTNTLRIIMPVRGPKGENRGHIARVPPGWNVNPKALRYTVNDSAPWAHWCIVAQSECLIVVEDIPSSVRLNELGYSTVALCGVRMDPEVADEIADTARLWKMQNVLVALDKDAANLTFKYAKALLMRGLPAEPLLIEKDFKNMTAEEIMCTVSNDS